MISSKLILFFCFYLLLDNSLGQKSLVEEGENKKTFKNAIEFGATYGGELGELGSQWKQLLIQLVQAKRKVGLGKYQLARFNDSATEEVGLAISDSYADKVAELVEIRTQDIGTTQKYVDALEILQNEIALTMIVKMEEIKEKFKETNVRKKVKEAKENGITDTDIKEILFADYFHLRLSLIGARASSAYALLTSFLKGMLSIIDENYFEALGILQYGNEIGGGVYLEGGGSAGGDGGTSEGDGDVPGEAGVSGGSPSGGSGGGSGDPPGGPPTAPPTGPPSVVDIPDDPDEQEGDDKKKVKDPHKDLAGYFQSCYEGLNRDDIVEIGGGEEARELHIIPLEGEDGAPELTEAEIIVEMHISPIRRELVRFERNVSLLEREEADVYRSDPILQFPADLMLEERLQYSTLRYDHFNEYSKRIQTMINRYFETHTWLSPRCELTKLNYFFFNSLFDNSEEALPSRLAPPARYLPPPIEEFQNITSGNDRMRFLVSSMAWDEYFNITRRYDVALATLQRIESGILDILEEEDNIFFGNDDDLPPIK